MRFLLDQNLSARLTQPLQDDYEGTTHVREFALQAADDLAIWEFAKERGYAILSKDADFHQLSFLYGHPPKVVWVGLGNCTTDEVLDAIHRRKEDIENFERDEQASFLSLS